MREQEAVLITGAAGGMGVEMVTRLSRVPYSPIYAVDIDPSVLSKFSQYPNVIAIQADVRSKRQIDGVFGKIAADLSPLGVVINGAGEIFAQSRTLNSDHRQIGTSSRQRLSLWRTNTDGALYIMNKAEGLMEENGGVIVNITSSKNYFPDPYRMDYMRSKLSLEQGSLRRAKELGRRDIRVVVVKPGNIKTGIDKGTWVDGSSVSEAAAVQGLNEWWRNHLSSPPSKVAEAVCKIISGEIQDSVVHVGFDARLGNVLSRIVPFWEQAFYSGSSIAYGLIKMATNLKTAQVAINYGDVNHLKGEWLREVMDEQMEGRAVLVKDNGQEFYFQILGSPSCSYAEFEEMGTNSGEVFGFLNRKALELGNSTRLTVSCEPSLEGEWQYKYLTEKSPKSSNIFGYEIVLYKGIEIYRSNSIFMPVP